MRVTVGIPVFNDQENILRCLDSILTQSYWDLEVIVSDNASSDTTLERIKSRAKDPRLIILKENENRGLSHNFKKVLNHATSPRFLWLGSDDYLEKNAIESLVNYIALKDKYAVGITNFYLYSVDDPKKITSKVDFGMDKTGGIQNIVRRVFSDEKINYTIMGLYDTEVLRTLITPLPKIKSADRWMNLGGCILGVKYYYVKDAIQFRGVKAESFVVKNKKDASALAITNNSMMADLKNVSLLRNYLSNLGKKNSNRRIKVEIFIAQYILYCAKKNLKISLHPIVMKFPLALRSTILREPGE